MTTRTPLTDEEKRERRLAQKRDYMRRCRERNPDAAREYQQQYYLNNRDHLAPKHLEYQRQHRPEARLSMRNYRLRNPDKGPEYTRRWRQRNPHKAREYERKRRALKAGALHVPYLRVDVYERDGWVCQLCNKPVDPNLKPAEPMGPNNDHRLALRNGGHDTFENSQLAHRVCNLKKGRKYWFKSLPPITAKRPR